MCNYERALNSGSRLAVGMRENSGSAAAGCATITSVTLPFLPFSREGPHASEAVQTWFDDTRTDDCGWNTSAIEEYWQYGEV